MKALALLAGVVLSAIGVGVGVEAASPSPPPPASVAGVPQTSGVYGFADGRFVAAFPVAPRLINLDWDGQRYGAVLEARGPGTLYSVEELAIGGSAVGPGSNSSISFAVLRGTATPVFSAVRMDLEVNGKPTPDSGWFDRSRTDCTLHSSAVVGHRLASVEILGVSKLAATRFLASIRAVP